MADFWRLLRLAGSALLLSSAVFAEQTTQTPTDRLLPCEAYSESAAVFIGVAGAPVKRWVQLPDHPPLQMTLTPMAVERAYVGVETPVMYLLPLGVERRPTAGQTYLVYGRGYHPPDIVMASPPHSAKDIATAAADLEFLEALTPGIKGGTISGVVQLKDLAYGGIARRVTPLPSIVVRIFNELHSTEAVTTSDGRFSAFVPAGRYELRPELPDELTVWDSTSPTLTMVADAGCRVVTIDTLFNGRVRGVLRDPSGKPLSGRSVDLMPMDVPPDKETGHVIGMGSVSTNENGEFEFAGRPPGRYYLGVNLLRAPSAYAPAYPRTYYPGTTDRESAIPVVVERGRASEIHDFSIPTILAQGEIELFVASDVAGKMTVCLQALDGVNGRATYEVRSGESVRRPVVDGHRYQVHAHVEFPGGHLESEPIVFKGARGKAVVTLRPDAPRNLHP